MVQRILTNILHLSKIWGTHIVSVRVYVCVCCFSDEILKMQALYIQALSALIIEHYIQIFNSAFNLLNSYSLRITPHFLVSKLLEHFSHRNGSNNNKIIIIIMIGEDLITGSPVITITTIY